MSIVDDIPSPDEATQITLETRNEVFVWAVARLEELGGFSGEQMGCDTLPRFMIELMARANETKNRISRERGHRFNSDFDIEEAATLVQMLFEYVHVGNRDVLGLPPITVFGNVIAAFAGAMVAVEAASTLDMVLLDGNPYTSGAKDAQAMAAMKPDRGCRFLGNPSQ